MSPQAIHSLIDMFGVEHGVQILNLFTAPEETEKAWLDRQRQKPPVRTRPGHLIRDIDHSREISKNPQTQSNGRVRSRTLGA